VTDALLKNGTLGTIDRLYQRYRPLVFLAVLALLAFGFDFRTPSSQFREVRAEVATLHAADSIIKRTQAQDRVLLEGVARGFCLTVAPRDRELLGLPCDDLMQRRRP
jgi:hypothetical protein